jgi:hypothetical protein
VAGAAAAVARGGVAAVKVGGLSPFLIERLTHLSVSPTVSPNVCPSTAAGFQGGAGDAADPHHGLGRSGAALQALRVRHARDRAAGESASGRCCRHGAEQEQGLKVGGAGTRG